MEGFKIAAFLFVLWGCQLYTVQCCTKIYGFSGQIYEWTSYGYKRCWKLTVPTGYFIRLQMVGMTSSLECEEDYVGINITGNNDELRLCSSGYYKNPITGFGNVTVTYSKQKEGSVTEIRLYYLIRTLECLNRNSFKCDDHICVSEEKVCDGVKDCRNGNDEIGCETGLQTIKEIPAVKNNAISWLKQKRTVFLGWKNKTPRAVVALFLASAASFNGSILEEDFMAKQTEFEIAVSFLKSEVTSGELGIFINALLVTCHNPRQFYGKNLVQRLKDLVQESGNFTHPLAYLALCNANESWPAQATSYLNSILSSNSEYPFAKDLQAMAVIALSCEVNRNQNTSTVLSNTLALYRETIQHLKELQALDGSFGNAYTTALITQALFASGQEHSRDWNLNATMKYLMKELNSTSVDFLTTYMTLPILNNKTLMDISNVNCSNPRKHGDDPYSEITNDVLPKLRVQYSLYVGDENPTVYTIPLRIHENSTAFKVMELAETRDRKYKFEWKNTLGKMYVYEIGNIKNDPEVGRFWLLYLGTANSSEPLTHLTKGPDEIIMADGQHLVFWYKTATI